MSIGVTEDRGPVSHIVMNFVAGRVDLIHAGIETSQHAPRPARKRKRSQRNDRNDGQVGAVSQTLRDAKERNIACASVASDTWLRWLARRDDVRASLSELGLEVTVELTRVA